MTAEDVPVCPSSATGGRAAHSQSGYMASQIASAASNAARWLTFSPIAREFPQQSVWCVATKPTAAPSVRPRLPAPDFTAPIRLGTHGAEAAAPSENDWIIDRIAASCVAKRSVLQNAVTRNASEGETNSPTIAR